MTVALAGAHPARFRLDRLRNALDRKGDTAWGEVAPVSDKDHEDTDENRRKELKKMKC